MRESSKMCPSMYSVPPGFIMAKTFLSEWNASRIMGYEKILHLPEFEGKDVTFRKVFELNEPAQKSIFIIILY